MVLQTYLLNKALMIGDIMAVYPVMMSFWILFGVTGGVVFYQTEPVNLSGVALLIVGCYFMAQHEKRVAEARRKSGGQVVAEVEGKDEGAARAGSGWSGGTAGLEDIGKAPGGSRVRSTSSCSATAVPMVAPTAVAGARAGRCLKCWQSSPCFLPSG